MARRRGKKTVKTTESLQEINENCTRDPKETQTESQEPKFVDHEVERQIAAIRAVRDVEIERLLTDLRLLRSHFNKEQLQSPLLQCLEKFLPNLSVVNDKENKQFEVRWNVKDSRLSVSCADGRDMHASLLQRLSMAYPDSSTAIPPFGGFEYSGKTVRTSFLGADNLHIKDFVLEEPSETQTRAMQEVLQTPGVTSQRLSVGMTPKTLRQPKPGEMLLSVHGSPLGVYKENNMEAIHDMICSDIRCDVQNQKSVDCLLDLLSGSLLVRVQARQVVESLGPLTNIIISYLSDEGYITCNPCFTLARLPSRRHFEY